MEQPLVSVITVTRNRGNLLGRCITSVLGQTYKNVEHVVVDGASEDNTDEVVASFKDDRLKFYKLDYNWPGDKTQEFAISKCNGKYISFLDSDDEYLPTKLEKQVKLIESLSEDYGFVYCWMTYFDSSKGNKVDHTHCPQLKGFVGDEVVKGPIVTGTPTLLFRLDFFKSFGGWKSKEEIGIVDDWEMCARACQLTKVDYIPESLVNVYINHGSVRQSEDKKYYTSACERLIFYHNYFLSYFSEVFERHPRYRQYHYRVLARSYGSLKRRKEALKYYSKYLSTRPSVKEAMKVLIAILIGH